MRFQIGKFTKIWVAVIGGNAIYFAFHDHWPTVFRHQRFALDWGILLDFWICVLLWLVLDLVSNPAQRGRRSR